MPGTTNDKKREDKTRSMKELEVTDKEGVTGKYFCEREEEQEKKRLIEQYLVERRVPGTATTARNFQRSLYV